MYLLARLMPLGLCKGGDVREMRRGKEDDVPSIDKYFEGLQELVRLVSYAIQEHRTTVKRKNANSWRTVGRERKGI